VQPGPLAGSPSSVGAAGFNQSYVQVPYSLAYVAGSMSVSLWFNTTATNGVLFSQSADPVTSGTTTSPYSPVLYIGSDGKLLGGFGGTGAPLSSAAAVNNGHWHHDVLPNDPGGPLPDGNRSVEVRSAISPFVVPYVYPAAASSALLPDEQYSGQSLRPSRRTWGDVGRAPDPAAHRAEVSLMYQANPRRSAAHQDHPPVGKASSRRPTTW
jgi:hypothetical protein